MTTPSLAEFTVTVAERYGLHPVARVIGLSLADALVAAGPTVAELRRAGLTVTEVVDVAVDAALDAYLDARPPARDNETEGERDDV